MYESIKKRVKRNVIFPKFDKKIFDFELTLIFEDTPEKEIRDELEEVTRFLRNLTYKDLLEDNLRRRSFEAEISSKTAYVKRIWKSIIKMSDKLMKDGDMKFSKYATSLIYDALSQNQTLEQIGSTDELEIGAIIF